MAYLFNALSDEAGEAGKQNIFGGQQTDQGTTSGGGAFNKGAAPPSTPSGGGGVPSGGRQAAAGQKQQQAYNPAGASAAYGAASKSMNLPQKTFQQAEGALAKSSQQLQEQADAYKTKAQDTAGTYGLTEETLQGAAEGKGEEYKKTANRLIAASPAEQFEAFQAGPTANVDYLRDPGKAFRAEAGPRYTAGQSRFDAALLRRNPEFIKRQQELLGQGQALQKEAVKRQEDETKAAREMLGTAYGTETEKIKGRLGGLSTEITDAAKKRELDEEALRAGLDPKALEAAEEAKIKAQIRQDMALADPYSEQGRMGRFLDEDVDLSGLLNIDKDVDWQELITDPEAQKYNRLQGLLGNADMLTAGAGAGAQYEFDPSKTGYQTVMGQAQGKRKAADIAGQARMAEIQGGATGRAGEKQAGAKARFEELLPAYQAMKNAMAAGGGKESQDGFVFTPTGEVTLPGWEETPMSWQDMLSTGEADELNALQSDLGILNPTQYQAAGPSAPNPYARVKGMEDELDRYNAPPPPITAGPNANAFGLPMAPPPAPTVAASGGGRREPAVKASKKDTRG